eukprot:scaffold22577_cov122-Cylindrotheca_fusiformis.AAC.19
MRLLRKWKMQPQNHAVKNDKYSVCSYGYKKNLDFLDTPRLLTYQKKPARACLSHCMSHVSRLVPGDHPLLPGYTDPNRYRRKFCSPELWSGGLARKEDGVNAHKRVCEVPSGSSEVAGFSH